MLGKKKINWECRLHDFSLLPERSGLMEVRRGFAVEIVGPAHAIAIHWCPIFASIFSRDALNLRMFLGPLPSMFLKIAGWHESVSSAPVCWHCCGSVVKVYTLWLFKRDFKLFKKLLYDVVCILYVQYDTRIIWILYVFNGRDYTLAVFSPHDFYMFTNH